MRGKGKRKFLLGSLAVLLLVIGFGYYQLGGFNSVTLEVVEVDNYYLLGRSFEGNYQSDTVRIYFNEMKTYLEQDVVQGYPVIIYDQEPEGQREYARCFIGIVSDGTSAIDSLEVRNISAKKCIRVFKDGHIAVIPNPEKINKMIKTYAAVNNLTLAGPNIEIYYPDNRMAIERPVVD